MPSIDQVTQGQSDPGLKESGVVHKFVVPDCPDPVELTLRSAASNAARIWENKTFREQRQYYEGDNIPPIEIIDQNEINKLAEALVVAWNITNADGSDAPCTPTLVRRCMKLWPDLRRDAIAATVKHDRYRIKQAAAIVKNSETPSSLHSGTAAVSA